MHRSLRAAILIGAIALMIPSTWGHSVTAVEVAHLPAGIAAWQRGSLGMYRVCGPVSKFLYAMPAYFAGFRANYPAEFDTDVESRLEWVLGAGFQERYIQCYHDLYRWSRLLPIVVTVLGGCLICEFSTRLFGAWPGIVSLCLWCGMPAVLAHGSLITSDVLSAVLMVAGARSYWSFLLTSKLRYGVLAGIVLGLAAATKFTLLVLYPSWAILLAVRAVHLRAYKARAARVCDASCRRLLSTALLMFVLSVIVINICYLCCDSWMPLSKWRFGHSSLSGSIQRLGQWRATAWLLNVPIPLPLEFLRGLDFQLADTDRMQSAYLLGETRLGGWSYWYAVATLIKTPLPAVLLMGMSFLVRPSATRQSDAQMWASLCLLMPAAEAALVISVTTGTGTNAAFRYLLPSIALLCVWTGRAANSGAKTALRLRAFLLAWFVVNSVTALPDPIAWRNELGWLCSRERPALIGDSFDWGQDLARLGKWIAEHSHEGPTVVYAYGMGSGAPYHVQPPAAVASSRSQDRAVYLAISENILFGYDSSNCVRIGGARPSVTLEQQRTLLSRRPLDRVGRTIRVYRIADDTNRHVNTSGLPY